MKRCHLSSQIYHVTITNEIIGKKRENKMDKKKENTPNEIGGSRPLGRQRCSLEGSMGRKEKAFLTVVRGKGRGREGSFWHCK